MSPSTMTDDNYSLDKLRSTLIRLEDTIIFGKDKEQPRNYSISLQISFRN